MALYHSETYTAKNSKEYEIRTTPSPGSNDIEVYLNDELADPGIVIPADTEGHFLNSHGVTASSDFNREIKEVLDRLP